MGNYGTSEIRTVSGINGRLKIINEQVQKGMNDPYIVSFTLRVVRGSAQHGEKVNEDEIGRVFWTVKNNIEYRLEPPEYDRYASARKTLEWRAGDCDDHTILICSMLGSLGYRTGARLISPDSKGWHIYALCGVPKESPTESIALDSTQPDSYPSWEPPSYYRKYQKHITWGKRAPLIEDI